MSRTFTPRMDVLPAAQKRLWPALRGAAQIGFVLYGGTAIALRLRHRQSIDFDFFCAQPLDRAALVAALPFIATATLIQDERNALSVLVADDSAAEPSYVKVSFFGLIDVGRVGVPDVTEDGVLQVASLDDLMAMKVKVVLQRAEAKDYCDVAAMLRQGVSLARGLAAARLMFGPNFQPSESLKALAYFSDGDLRTLRQEDRDRLVHAVRAVRGYPAITLQSKTLALT